MSPTPLCRLFTCFMHCTHIVNSSCCPYGRGKIQGDRLVLPLDESHCNCGLLHSFPLSAGSVCGVRLGRCSSSEGQNNGYPIGMHHDTDGNLRAFFMWKPSGRVNCGSCPQCSCQGVTEFVWASGCSITDDYVTNMYEYMPTRFCSCPGSTLYPLQCLCTSGIFGNMYSRDYSRCNNSLVGYNSLTGKRSITGFQFRCLCWLGMVTSFVTDEPAVDWQSGTCCFMGETTEYNLNWLRLCSRYNCICRQCVNNVLPTNGLSWSFHYCCGGCVKSCTIQSMYCTGCGGLPLCPGFCDSHDLQRRYFTLNQYLCQCNNKNVGPATWVMCPKP